LPCGGIHTLNEVNGKSALVSAVEFALSQQNVFRKEIIGVKFADDTPESRADSSRSLTSTESICAIFSRP
jgi:hypothetical protein